MGEQGGEHVAPEPCVHSMLQPDCVACWYGQAYRASKYAQELHQRLANANVGNSITIDLGDAGSHYPPQVATEHVEPLRRWFAKNTTANCAMGLHSYDQQGCRGICAEGSAVVEERPCLCPCHAERYTRATAASALPGGGV